jgi:DNA-binding NarL/FixJ family response regulator
MIESGVGLLAGPRAVQDRDQIYAVPTVVSVVVADSESMAGPGVEPALGHHGFTVVARPRNAEEAIATAISEQPDLCLVAADLPGGGLEALDQIARKAPGVKLALVADSLTQAAGVKALRAGATGYLLRTMAPEQMTSAIDAMMRGELAFPRAFTKGLAQEVRRLSVEAEPEKGGWIAWRVLYLPRFFRHFRRRRRTGMRISEARASAHRRMQKYR